MTIRPARLAEIHALIDAKSAAHSELRRPLGLAGFRRVLKREGVEISLRPHARPAQLVPFLGGWTIIIDHNQPADARLLCGCHELAHLWLHHDPFFARHETTIYDKSPPWYDAVREEEADAMAELLVRGPQGENKGSAVTPLFSRRAKPRNAAVTEPRDPDGDAFVEMVRRVPPEPPAPRPAVVQFAIPREVWQDVHFDEIALTGARYPYYESQFAGPTHELVTCSEDAATLIVRQLARAGHKRAAVHVRRTIRETQIARANSSRRP